ncbi:MAG: hypothetical protein Q8R91_07360 [Candidatus Omnitrophota bacterium]|nr:hypothetical protein [Candidatus Omnitrophota bacterium]
MRRGESLVGVWLLGCLSALALGQAVATAEVPRKIHYQGRLTDPAGQPLVGDHTVTLRIYDAETGGAALWEEQHTLAFSELDSGVFSVILGSTTPFSAAITFNAPLWLSTEVDGAGEFSPRQQLAAVTYAINADMLDGLDSQQLLASAGTITGVTAGNGLTGGGTSGTVTLNVGAGTTANKIVQLDATGALPAVSGANLTTLNASNLASGAVPDARLSAAVSLLGQTIDSAELVDGTIVNADLSDTAAIADTKLATIATAGKVADSTLSNNVSLLGQAIDSAEIADGTIVNADLSAIAAIEDTKLATIATAGKVADSALSSNVSLLGSSIESAEIADSAIGAADLGADSVGAEELAGDAIQSGDVEYGDLPSLVRSSTAATSSLAIGTSDTTLLSVTANKTNASSALLIIASVAISSGSGGGKTLNVKLLRDGTPLDGTYTTTVGSGDEETVMIHAWDATTQGSHTIDLRASANKTGATTTVRRLTVVEL